MGKLFTITSNHSFDTVSGRKEVTLNLTGQIFDEPNAVFTLDDIPILGVDVPTYSNSTEVVPGQTGLSSTHSRMRLTVDHPYADEGGTSLDQTTDYNVKPVGNYVVGASFGEITRSQQLKTAQGRLQDLLVDNSGATDLQRTSQSLYVMGLSWLRQTALTTDILDSVSGTRKQSAHRVGVIGQEESYFVDFRTQFSSTNTRKANSGIPGALFPSNSFTGSALEHGVLEQLQGSDKNVASTISIVADAVNSGDKVFMFDGSMSQNAKDDLMINGNYSASFVNGREFELQQNIFDYLLLPAVEAEIDDWNGQGYVGFRQDGIGGNILMGINGDLIDQPIGGGFPTSAGGIDFYAVGGNAEINTVYSALDFSTASTSCGPVNFNTGDKLESITDMVAGNLVFSRNYNSREHRVKTDIGPGWRHSFDITANVHSDENSALGFRAAADMAPMLIAQLTTRELLEGTPNVKDWTVAVLVNDWAIEQMQDNAVTIRGARSADTFQCLEVRMLGLDFQVFGMGVLENPSWKTFFEEGIVVTSQVCLGRKIN